MLTFLMKESEEAQEAGRYIKTIRDPDKRLYAQRYFFYLLGYDLKNPSSRPLKEEDARELQVAIGRFFETSLSAKTSGPVVFPCPICTGKIMFSLEGLRDHLSGFHKRVDIKELVLLSGDEAFPKRKESLKKLGDYKVIETHDDGDLTVESNGKLWVVTTEGQTFEQKQYSTTDKLPQTEDYEVVEMFCQKCGKKIPSPGSFSSPEAMRNYMITGLCEECQGVIKTPSGNGHKTKQLPQTKKEYWVKIIKRGASSYSEGSLIRWEEFKEDDRRVRERGEEPASVEIVKEPHPGNGNGGKEVPATVQGEPIPEKYRPLIPLIDEPLPPESDYLVPAIVPEEGERKIDAVLRQLKEGVEGIQNSEQFRLFLTTMAKFHDYSLGNQILIALQKPEATRVAGFQTWKNLGRWVKKGATGIAILAPVLPPKPKEEKKDEEEEVPLTPVYFKVVHVFDISQTEGQPLPEFEVPSLTGEANEDLFTKALALGKAQGLEVSFDPMPSQDPALKGFYSGKKIWVKPDESRAQQLKTLLHEMAHYYSEGVFRIPRRDAETIAESAAFAVGAHFGFDSGVRSFPYVALWSQDPKVLKTNLGSVRKVTSVMLEGLEKPEQKLMPQTESKGTCYQDTWRFLIKEKEGHLVHGTVWNGDKRIGHAWVETDTGYIWEPETKKFYTKLGFEVVASPVEQHRYTPTEAAVMAARTKNFGPWSDEEMTDYLKRKSPAVIPNKPCFPNCKEEQEFIADSPELIPFTIDDIGYRDKLDNAFEAAISRVQGD